MAGQGFRGRPGVQGGRPGVQGPARGPGWPARGSGAGPFPTRGPDLFAPILKSSVINLMIFSAHSDNFYIAVRLNIVGGAMKKYI